MLLESLGGLFNDTIDNTLQGIQDYFTNRSALIQKASENFIPREIITEDRKITLIEGIYIDIATAVNSNYNSSTADHTLDSNSVISESRILTPETFSLNCKLTSIDHKEKYNKLLKLNADTTKLITLMYDGEIITNLAITNITKNTTNVTYSSLNVSFKKYRFVTIATIPNPQMKKVVSKTKENKGGKLQTNKEVVLTEKQLKAKEKYYEVQKKSMYLSKTPEIVKLNISPHLVKGFDQYSFITKPNNIPQIGVK